MRLLKIAAQRSKSQGYQVTLTLKRTQLSHLLEYQDKTKTKMSDIIDMLLWQQDFVSISVSMITGHRNRRRFLDGCKIGR